MILSKLHHLAVIAVSVKDSLCAFSPAAPASNLKGLNSVENSTSKPEINLYFSIDFTSIDSSKKLSNAKIVSRLCPINIFVVTISLRASVS